MPFELINALATF
jgi:hypothetical protein